MKSTVIAVLFIALLAFSNAKTANADVMTLTFEGLDTFDDVGDFYNGGPGGSYGVSFSGADAWISSSAEGGLGNFANAPSGVTAIALREFPSFTMNVYDGFVDMLTFFYASPYVSASIAIYGGLNGTGDLLAYAALPMTYSDFLPGQGYSPFVDWELGFEGVGLSAVFGISPGRGNMFVDDISFTPRGAAVPTPEPATALLLAAGLLGLMGARRFRRR